MKEVYKDEGGITGRTHSGGVGDVALQDFGVHFDVHYAIGRLLENVTQDTSGVVTAHTRHTATATGVTWDDGDEYVLYLEATKNAVISSTEVCRMSGFAYPRDELGPDGIHPRHADRDRKVMDGERRRK